MSSLPPFDYSGGVFTSVIGKKKENLWDQGSFRLVGEQCQNKERKRRGGILVKSFSAPHSSSIFLTFFALLFNQLNT